MLICFSWLEALNLCRPSQTLGMFQLHFNIIIARYSPATLIKVEGFPVCYIFQTFQTPSGCYGALASSSPGDFFFSRPGLGMWFMFSTCSSLQQKDGVGCWCSRCLKNKREGKKTTSSNWVTGRKSNNSPLSSLWTNGFRRLRRDLGGEFLCARRRVGCSRCLCFIESIDHCFNLMPPFPFSPCLSVSCLTLLLIRDARTHTHTHTDEQTHIQKGKHSVSTHLHRQHSVEKKVNRL